MAKIEFIPPTDMDIEYIGANIREADRAEMFALESAGGPANCLKRSVRLSLETAVVTVDGEPACIFGLAVGSILSGIARPWLMGTDLIENNGRLFLRHNRSVVKGWAERWHLENWVHADHAVSVRWLKWLGFTLDDAKPVGPYKIPFHRFEMRRVCATQ